MTDNHTVRCSECSKVIGVLVPVGDLELLDTGGALARTYHGICKCGTQFHFIAEDQMLTRLVNRVLMMRVSVIETPLQE